MANFGQIDDPLNAGALRNSTHGLSPGGTTLTLTITRASDRAFRLAVMLGNHPPFAFEEDITVSAGGQAMVRHVGSTTEPAAVYHLFDIGPGLAPVIVQQVFERVRRIRENGLTVLIVEQNVQQVLKVVDRAYLLEAGSIRMSGTSAELMASDTIREAYLGV